MPTASVYIENRSCDRSPGCPARRICPQGAIVPMAGGAYPGANGYIVEEDKCAGCGLCVRVCPGGAVRLS
jgi:Fe-S-cluster-containing hydrogenase component 2